MTVTVFNGTVWERILSLRYRYLRKFKSGMCFFAERYLFWKKVQKL